MKRMLGLALLSLVGSLFTAPVALAASPPKTASVALAYSVDASGLVTLTATSAKYGSNFSDSWTGATKVATVRSEINGEDYYVSTATFSAANLALGTYTVTYTITMTAGRRGNSNARWTGSASTSFIIAASGLPPGGGVGSTV